MRYSRKVSKQGIERIRVNGRLLKDRRIRHLSTGDAVVSIELSNMNPHDLFHAQNGFCFYCGEMLELQRVTRDHFFPRSVSKRNESLRGNCVLACPKCNNEEKGNRLPTVEEMKSYLALYGGKILVDTSRLYNGA